MRAHWKKKKAAVIVAILFGWVLHAPSFSMRWSFSLMLRGGDQPGRALLLLPAALDGGGDGAPRAPPAEDCVGRWSMWDEKSKVPPLRSSLGFFFVATAPLSRAAIWGKHDTGKQTQ